MSELFSQPFADFIAADHKPSEFVIAPWLPKRGIEMIWGWRGTGKTFITQHVGYAIASCGSVLDWEVPQPRKVLHVDGEMDAAELCERYKAIHEAALQAGGTSAVGTNLHLLTDAQQDNGIPNLAEPEAQRKIEVKLKATGAEVLILDNVSSLVHEGSEGSDESWGRMQDWLRKLRRDNITTLLVHHAGKGGGKGKGGDQRGTSKREDILNSSIKLVEGKSLGRMTLSFEKHRGFVDPGQFEVQLDYEESGLCTLTRVVDLTATIIALSETGASQRVIARQVGCSVGTVNAKLQKYKVRAAELRRSGLAVLRSA